MKPGHLLTIILVSLLILSFAIVLIKSDVLQMPPEKWVPPSNLNIRDVDVKPVVVTSSQIEVNVTAYINHAGAKTRNATMLIRAISSDTRLLQTQVSAPIPEIGSELEKTLAISTNLNLERNGGYDLNILLFDNGSIMDSGSVSISGLNALTPMSKQSGVTLSNIDFTVSNVSTGKVSIKSDIYLENRGPQVSENLKVTVKAREATSNLLADKTGTETGVIANESTAVKSVVLAVPEGYNYMVVVELWKGDTLINSWEKPVLLAPTKTVPKESVEKQTNIEVSKFVRESGATSGYGAPGYPVPMATGTPMYAGATPKEPGFEIFAAISALLIVFVLRRRL
ncbi:MAG: PGF-CTERM sorting domain-containing protein [Candidatus Methanoperedens sp.]|nr:PGF-CTERM sorting domain-containing protein [Candidatus Methanoperedens sp.]MCZ7406537.1 PGF-CTERM sorting domain-containing protein [Candidatus Methanoperedens sp.]